MSWKVVFLPEADRDMAALDGSQRLLVRKAIAKASQNPLPQNEGGYGKPLGSKGGANLSGFLKLKLRNCGLRIVYTNIRKNDEMLIVVIGVREAGKVYDEAAARIAKHGLKA